MLRRRLAEKISVACIWLALWAVAAASVGQALLLPSPWQVAVALAQLAGQAAFWRAVDASVLRILAGFAIGMLTGFALAVLTSRFRWWHAFFSPFLSAVKATPVASFIMLALVWLRVDGVPVFATFLIVLPVVWANVSAGIGAADPQLLEMARAFRMPRWQRVRRVYWPTIRPYFRAAITMGMGMAWKAGVAAEVIATPRQSLGAYLYNAKIYLDTSGLFATTAVVIVLSILLERLVKRLAGEERKEDARA